MRFATIANLSPTKSMLRFFFWLRFQKHGPGKHFQPLIAIVACRSNKVIAQGDAFVLATQNGHSEAVELRNQVQACKVESTALIIDSMHVPGDVRLR